MSPAIYSFLNDLGLRTTKAVWPIRGNGTPKLGGATCEDEQYLKWMLRLKEQGFEIALHNVTYHTSTREQTAARNRDIPPIIRTLSLFNGESYGLS